MMKEPLNLIITGVGGQGNVLISGLIGGALVKMGYFVTVGETYGVSQRGGTVMSHVRISSDYQYSPIIPDGRGDMVIGLEPLETLRVLGQYGNPLIDVLTNLRPIYPIDVLSGEKEYPPLDRLKRLINELSNKAWFIDASDKALELGTAAVTNMVMVGAFLATDLLPLSKDLFESELKEKMPDDKLELNLQALGIGFEALKH
jgi:indolepyruvate ferredoxin oxidoreductase beta subunit